MALRDIFLWLAGHDPATLREESREATQPIVLVGAAVALAALVTGTNWGIAGFGLAGGNYSPQAWSAAAIAALFAALVVIVIDRAGVFALDAQSPGLIRKGALLGVRVGICCLVSAVTTQFITPHLLEKESKAFALEQREQKDAARAKALHERFDISGLREAVGAADLNVNSAAAAITTVPLGIQAMDAEAKTCWRQYAGRKQALLAKKIGEVDARNQLAAHATRCTAASTTVRRELTTHREKAKKALEDAAARQSAARASLVDAEATIKQRLVEAAKIEKDAISPQSTRVTEGVMEASPAARRKWWATYVLILLLELAPLALKGIAGPSAPGARMAVDHDLTVAGHQRRRENAIHAKKQRVALRDAMDEAKDAALLSVETRDRFKALFESKLDALLPLDVAKRIVAEIEEAHDLRLASARRCPGAVDAINAAWDQAMDELTARLHGRPSVARRPMAAA